MKPFREYFPEYPTLIPADVNWNYISQEIELPEEFIERFHENFNWVNICFYQNLSEEFIEKHIIKQITIDRTKQATYRTASRKITKPTTKSLISFAKQYNQDVGSFTTLLESEVGKSLISGFIGLAIANTPKLKNDNRIQLLAEEFQVESIAMLEESILDMFIEYFSSIITESLESNEQICIEDSSQSTEEQLENYIDPDVFSNYRYPEEY